MENTQTRPNRGRVLALALALDLLLGEPPADWHPVVWMGRLVGAMEHRAPGAGPLGQLAYGMSTEVLCLAAAAVPAGALERSISSGSWVGLLVQAVALKPTFAVRALFQSADRVGSALRAGDLPRARSAVGQIVSRDVGALDEAGVAAAAVESLAENASDSVVAPLLYYAAFGLPGAYGYRMANTLDAMLGYRGRYEYLGKAAARVDDLLNLLPSRLAAAATAATCRLAGCNPRQAWRVALRDSSRTASPNAGWPMAATAGALGLRLEKVGHYTLNPEGRLPGPDDLGRARRVVAVGLVGTIGALLLALRFRPGGMRLPGGTG